MSQFLEAQDAPRDGETRRRRVTMRRTVTITVPSLDSGVATTSPETVVSLAAGETVTDGERTGRFGRLGVTLVVLAAVFAALFVAAGPASAYARGCSFWNPFSVGGYSLAAGQYCAEVDGYSTWIYNVEGDFTSAANICNWDITAEFFDQNWNWKRSYVSSHNYGCTHQARNSIYLPYYMSQLTGSNYGYMCSTLRVAGQRVTSVCHYIHP